MKKYYSNIQQEIDILLELESKITDNQKLKLLDEKKKEFFEKNIKQMEIFKKQYNDKETDTVKSIFGFHKALESLYTNYTNEPFFKEYTLKSTLHLLSRTEELNKLRDNKEKSFQCLDELSKLYTDIRDDKISTKVFYESFKAYKEEINNIEATINFRSNLATKVLEDINKQKEKEENKEKEDNKEQVENNEKEENKEQVENKKQEESKETDIHPIVIDGEKVYNKLNFIDKFKARVNAYEISEGKKPNLLRKVGLFLYSKTYTQDAKDYISNGEIKADSFENNESVIKTTIDNSLEKGVKVAKESGKWIKAQLEKNPPIMSKDKLTRLGAYADIGAVLALATLSQKAISNTLQPYNNITNKIEIESLDENAIKNIYDDTIKNDTVIVSFDLGKENEKQETIEQNIDNQKPKEVEELENNQIDEDVVKVVSFSENKVDDKDNTKKQETNNEKTTLKSANKITISSNKPLENVNQTDPYYRYESEYEKQDEIALGRKEQTDSYYRYESEYEKRDEIALGRQEQNQQQVNVNETNEINEVDEKSKENESVVELGENEKEVIQDKNIEENEVSQETIATQNVEEVAVTNQEIQAILDEVPTSVKQEIQMVNSTQEIQKQIDQLTEEISSIMANHKNASDFNIDLGVQAMNVLKANGLSQEAAAGIVGNVFAESRFKTDASNGTHFGLCQWSSGRYATVTSWMKENGKTGFEGQLEAAIYGEPKYANVVEKVKNAQTIEEACRIWQKEYEVCGASTDSRQAASKIASIASKRNELQQKLKSLQIDSSEIER